MSNLLKFTPAVALSALFAIAVMGVSEPAPQKKQEKIYKSLLSDLPRTVGEFQGSKPSLSSEIASSYNYLRTTCPAMAKVDISSPWNLADWMNKKITPGEWSKAPYSFRMNSFKAVSVQKNTQTKVEVLGKLYNSIPTHPAFLVWIDEGKEKFNIALHKDKFLNREKKHWDEVVTDDKRLNKYMTRVGELFIASFLDGQENVKIPQAMITKEDAGWQGQYSPNAYTVTYNFSTAPSGIKNATHADKIAAHENFHAIEDIIKNWSLGGKVATNSAFQDAGEKFFYGNHENLAHVSNAVNYDIYRNTFRERLAFYVMNAADTNAMTLQTRDADWKTVHPLNGDGSFPETGALPAACRIN